MKYIQDLVDLVRVSTENEESSAFTGISDTEFIQYLNDAQHHLQALIVSKHSQVFVDEAIVSVTSSQEKYSLPEDILLENKVHNIEYSSDGKNYFNLKQTNIKNRSDENETGVPFGYIRLSGKVLLTPIPDSSGFLKINYIRRIKELGLRQAAVKIADISGTQTLTNGSTNTISLNNNYFTTKVSEFAKAQFVTIVDKYGTVKLSNIPINISDETLLKSILHESLIVNMTDYTPKESDASKDSFKIAAGDFILTGKDVTTHSEFPTSVERYLISYAAWKILKRDSSVDSQEMQGELSLIGQEIVDSYSNITDDLQTIPIISEDDWSF